MKFLFYLTFALSLITLSHADIKEKRAKASKIYTTGNFKEALEIYKECLKSTSDANSSIDLDQAIKCFQNIHQVTEIDEFVEHTLTQHKTNFHVHTLAAKYYLNTQHYGVKIDEKFLRGNHHHNNGTRVNSTARDRVNTLILYEKAESLISTTVPELSESRISTFYINYASAYFSLHQTFKFQALTDTSKLPDYEENYYAHWHRPLASAAPTTKDGTPIFYSPPKTFEQAINDGERWRFLLQKAIEVNSTEKNKVTSIYADFLQSQFGVQTLNSYSWFRSYQFDPENEDKNSILTLYTLADDETTARLASGAKRFKLPDEHNFLKLHQELFENEYTDGRKLSEIYLNRMQFDKAEAILKEAIERDNRDHQKELLNNIINDWARFDVTSHSFPAGTHPNIGIVYRNVKSAELEIRKIDTDKLYQSTINFLKENPLQLDWQKLNITNLSQRLQNGSLDSFISDQAINKKIDLNPKEGHWDTRADISIPIEEAGAYQVKITLPNGKTIKTFAWLDSITVVRNSTQKGNLYSVTDSVTGKPIEGAKLEFFGYRQEYLNNRQDKRRYNIFTKKKEFVSDQNGQILTAKQTFESNYNWSIKATHKNSSTFTSFNRHYHHYNSSPHPSNTRSFAVTDRPVYLPGQKVYGKFWYRTASYTQGDISNFANQDFTIHIKDSQGQDVGKAIKVRSDEYGGIEYELELTEDAKLGSYAVSLRRGSSHKHVGSHYFRVEKYKKPEFEVKVESPSEPVKLGETFEATIKANYYHGAPVSKAKVKVKVMRHDHTAIWFPYGRWDWLYGSGYGWLSVERRFYPGFHLWGCKSPIPFWYNRQSVQPELVLEQEFDINPDGTVKVKIDSSLAKQVHGDKNQRYEITAEVVDASRRTIVGAGSTLATAKPFQVTVWTNRGHTRVGEKITATIAAKTLDGKSVQAEGTTKLFSINVDDDGKINETEVASWKTKTDDQGTAKQGFTCDVAGQYKVFSTLTDKKGRAISGGNFITIRGQNTSEENFAYNALEITPDKRTYKPGETAEILIKTKQKNSFVTIFLRGGKSYELLKLEGQSTLIKLPISTADMPNTFVNAFTVSNGKVHSATCEIIVPPAKRILNIEVLSDKEKYKPREDGQMTLKVTDENGEPVSGSLALSIYDKSLEYVSGGSNIGDIKKTFWEWRRRYYTNQIDSTSHYERSVVPKKELAMPNLGAFGHMVGDMKRNRGLALNEELDSSFGDKGADMFGAPKLKKMVGRDVKPSAPSSSAVKVIPAAGPVEIVVRNKFADLVKWQGDIITDEEGMATIPVTFPDNLTTWKIKAWGVSHGTKVGEGSAEVITSKDLIIRLQAPRFFVEKDEVTLSAVVHNYHKEAKEAKVSISLAGGTLDLLSPAEHTIKLAANNGEQRIDWNTKVSKEGKAIIKMKIITADDSDAMEMTFPVYVHGILKQESWSQVILPKAEKTTVEFNVPAERKPEQSRLEVRYSPTIAGSIISALPYLAEYPYGCTEQTLNRFVPTVICQKLLLGMDIDLEAVRNQRANLNPQEIGDDKERLTQWKKRNNNPVFDKNEVAKMAAKGVERLTEMQNSDGGWGWFSGYEERSYPHTTAVVIHGLHLAKRNGATIPQDIITRGTNWLKKYEAKEILKLKNAESETKPWKNHVNNTDALVRLTLAEQGDMNKEMLDFLFRDKLHLSTYGKSLLGLSLHAANDIEKRDAVIKNIEQLLIFDDENQTAYLNLRNSAYWWSWYGSEYEAQAWYLKLLAKTNPKSKQARGIVKYLVNNRKHATYWNSTRDTAYCIEAIAEYLQASGEFNPDATVEVLLDGKSYKKVTITKENLFSYDNKFVVTGDTLTTGNHTVEIRRTGSGPLYTNTYFTLFTKEDDIKKAGLEVKVERRYYKLTPDKEATSNVSGSHGQVVTQKIEKFTKTKLNSGDTVKSGDLIEVELIIESKNDYEYLLFADWKPSGCENVDVRSGYINNGLFAYMEVHDEKSAFFVKYLPRGKHNLTYQLRAEIPGKFSALPTQAEAMYAPELKANSNEIKIQVIDQ